MFLHELVRLSIKYRNLPYWGVVFQKPREVQWKYDLINIFIIQKKVFDLFNWFHIIPTLTRTRLLSILLRLVHLVNDFHLSTTNRDIYNTEILVSSLHHPVSIWSLHFILHFIQYFHRSDSFSTWKKFTDLLANYFNILK